MPRRAFLLAGDGRGFSLTVPLPVHDVVVSASRDVYRCELAGSVNSGKARLRIVAPFLFWDAGTGEMRRTPAPNVDKRGVAPPLTAKAVESKVRAVASRPFLI
jgi:hypothetical protein